VLQLTVTQCGSYDSTGAVVQAGREGGMEGGKGGREGGREKQASDNLLKA